MQEGKPYAAKSPLGWTVMGVLKSTPADETNITTKSYAIAVSFDEQLHKQMEDFWSTESFGTKHCDVNPMSVEDRRAIAYLEKSTKLVDGHYVAPMLWAEDSSLPNNFGLAAKRLELLSKRFQRDNLLYEKYKSNIEEFLSKGYARKLTKAEISNNNNRIRYLPHHPVMNPNKPCKVRTVLDAAAKYDGKSLNDYLITGPDLLNNLVGILLRFRKNPVALVADIEAMYHQVHLTEEDSDAVRFIWKEDFNQRPEVLKMLVHFLGAKDSPCIASFALKKTALDNKEDFQTCTVEAVLRDFYMDDLIKSCKLESEATTLASELKEMLSRGGFNLRKFNSNSEEVLRSLKASPNELFDDISFNHKEIDRTLGIRLFFLFI